MTVIKTNTDVDVEIDVDVYCYACNEELEVKGVEIRCSNPSLIVMPCSNCMLATNRKYAIGYCPSDNIPCRPKPKQIAVIFETDFRQWRTHLRIQEFSICFPEIDYKERKILKKYKESDVCVDIRNIKDPKG